MAIAEKLRDQEISGHSINSNEAIIEPFSKIQMRKNIINMHQENEG